MLWDLIRDFFVQHVFGGFDSNGVEYLTTIGSLTSHDGDIDGGLYAGLITFQIGHAYDTNSPINIGLPDWLSTTATAISITIIVVLCCLFVYKIIKLIGGLIR